MQRPKFLDSDVTDRELMAECSAVEAGQYAGWRLDRVLDDADREKGQFKVEDPETFREIWLDDAEQGRTEIVRLQLLHDRDQNVWRPVSSMTWLRGVF